MELSCWIQTVSGKRVDLLSPSSEEIDILDIAHALSLSCRFNGQCRLFYSVAEHCVRVSNLVRPSIILHALLHDAAEAYLPVCPRPIKGALGGFKEIERGLEEVIFGKWVKHLDHEQVKIADNIMLATEGRDLMGNTDGWFLPELPLPSVIVPWDSKRAEQQFLRVFFDNCERKEGEGE